MADQQLSQGNLPVFIDDLIADRTRQFVEFLDDEVSAFLPFAKWQHAKTSTRPKQRTIIANLSNACWTMNRSD